MVNLCGGEEAAGEYSSQCGRVTGGKHSPSTVLVSNLPSSFSSSSLDTVFREAGVVRCYSIINYNGSDLDGCSKLVQFSSFGDAKKAVEQLNGFPIAGSHMVSELMDVQIVIFSGLRDIDTCREIIQQAREIGSVLSVHYPLSKEETEIHGLGEEQCKLYAAAVIFTDVKSAKEAIVMLHNKEINGATVRAHSPGLEDCYRGKCPIPFRSAERKHSVEIDKGQELVNNTIEKHYLTPSRLVDKRSIRLFSTSHEEEPMEFYYGPEIFNTVTWPLNGSAGQVSAGHLHSSGHQRLWNFVRGQMLDVSSILGPDMVIFTTACTGTFSLNITFEEDKVTLPIDGREGWVYGIINAYGCFEFYHVRGDPYFQNDKNWSMLNGFLPDYSQAGLCPTCHEDIELGIPAARRACRILSNYKGELPVPTEVRKACATLITYGPEAVKSNEILEWTSGTLQDEEREFTLGQLNPFASRKIKRWSSLGESKLDYLVRKLLGEDNIFPVIPFGTGITTEQELLDSVCVLLFNKLLPRARWLSKDRYWSCYPLDRGAEMARGKPHFLSPQFARPWPTNQIAALRSPCTITNPSDILPFAKVRQRGFSSAAFAHPRAISSGAVAALKILKSLAK